MSYDARRKEVMEELEKTDHDPAAKEAIRRLLDSYFSQREGRLENLLEVLEPGDRSCHGAWLEKAKESAAAAHEALRGTDHGKLWLARISNEEHTFFFKLMVSQVPVKRDLMVEQTRALGKAEKEFEEKWETIRKSDASIDERMQTIAREYEEILDKAAKAAAEVEKESKEKTADLIRQGVSAALRLVNLGPVEYVLKGAASAIGVAVGQVKARRLEIQALLSREEGIFATFKEGREMVKAFLEDTSYTRVKDAFDSAEDAAEALAGDMLTEGQKDDAEAFGSAIKNELNGVFRLAEDAYKSFARKHEGLFFGPLRGEYYQELMEDDSWKRHSDNWKRAKRDIDDLLRERTFEVSEDKVLEVSLEGLEPDEKRRIYETLKTSCQELLRAWNDFKENADEPLAALESREALKRALDPFR